MYWFQGVACHISLLASFIADLITDYLEEFEGKLGRSKRYALEALCETVLAETPLCELTTQAVVNYARARRKTGTGGSTVNQDLIFLGTVLDYAQHAWHYKFDTQALPNARKTCRQSRITSSSKIRDRRPTSEEMRLLLEWFDKPRPRGPEARTPYASAV
ncbi:hypothetical protein [Halorhodospira halochloris]|uniref:hypothetical protein n=1 Tax=Halorhodospira halochloris TaxID=1052 RepID=UPI001EE78AF7|nr:hypothetical protein [Halorhodospira halochloris]MCG5548611.1 hypothetical protein [Halorhodospira halochloris]